MRVNKSLKIIFIKIITDKNKVLIIDKHDYLKYGTYLVGW